MDEAGIPERDRYHEAIYSGDHAALRLNIYSIPITKPGVAAYTLFKLRCCIRTEPRRSHQYDVVKYEESCKLGDTLGEAGLMLQCAGV